MWTYNYIIYPDELYHHGIKGQRWGVRRFQNKDGSLTAKGKKRYSENGEPKQTRYDKYYSKYKTLGYDDEQAQKSAKGRVATENALMIAGGVAVTAAAAYGAYRYYDSHADRFIAPDKILQTVHTGEASDRIKPGNPFYATYRKKDNLIYSSRVFSHFSDKSNITKMYTKDGIKVASEKTGQKIFDELAKTNPEVKEYARSLSQSVKKVPGKTTYQKFNWSLVLRNDSLTQRRYPDLINKDHDKIHKIFYDELKKRGYGAVMDINDSKTEGFTFNPVIVFDDQIKHIVGTTKATSIHMSDKRYLKGIAYAKQRDLLLKPWTDPAIAAAGAAYAYGLGVTAKNNRDVDKHVKIIQDYLKEHPNTKLTNKQILELYI